MQRDASGLGRALSAPGRFATDDGSPDAAIRHATDHRELSDALRSGRLIVAVVATSDDEGGGALAAGEKSSEMAVVSMIAEDGRRGLLAFSGLDSLRAWNPSARPVPVSGVDAARAAIDDECEALVIDVAGPRVQVIPEVDLLTVAGIDPLEHAQRVAIGHFDRLLGLGKVVVVVEARRLRIVCNDPTIDPREVASGVTTRLMALAPDGVEVTPA